MKYEATITTTFVKRVEVEAQTEEEAKNVICLTELDNALDDAEIDTEIRIWGATK